HKQRSSVHDEIEEDHEHEGATDETLQWPWQVLAQPGEKQPNREAAQERGERDEREEEEVSPQVWEDDHRSDGEHAPRGEQTEKYWHVGACIRRYRNGAIPLPNGSGALARAGISHGRPLLSSSVDQQ